MVMAEVLPPRPVSTDYLPHDGVKLPDISPTPMPTVEAPEPNPPFVFPARAASPARSGGMADVNRDASNTPRIQATPGLSGKVGSNRKSVNALPIFNFHPAGSNGSGELATGSMSTPTSPFAHQATSLRSGGHRRGGSEFIGGDGKKDGPGLMSSSPTKGDGVLPPPIPLLPPGGPTGRRGHAHRRSGAISCHDLSYLNKAADGSPGHRAGSAPTTPADPLAKPPGFFGPPSPTTTESLPLEAENNPVNPPSAAPNRTRVGFSDTLEFIPRPLSTLSSESSSTFATVRGHSLSGSISSIASAGNASPPSASRRKISVTSNCEAVISRPHTADAVMKTTTQAANASPPSKTAPVLKRSKSAADSVKISSRDRPTFVASTTAADKEKTNESRLEALTSSLGSASQRFRAHNFSHITPTSTPCRSPTGLSAKRTEASSEPSPAPSPDRTKMRQYGRRQRIVKTLAGSILLSRKAKHKSLKQKANARRSPTPPTMMTTTAAQGMSTPSLDFDEDSTFTTIISPPLASPRPVLNSIASEPIMRTTTTASGLGMPNSNAMIDLDAALGPFNTPDYGPEFGYVSQGGFLAAKRRMHSSGVTGGFSGPGMHYHRRAESAPEMVAFEFGQFNLHQLGSSSTMADVFEEDEEDEADHEGRSRKKAATEASMAEAKRRNDDQADDASESPLSSSKSWPLESPATTTQSSRGEEGMERPAAHDDSALEPRPLNPETRLVGTNEASPVEIADNEDPPRALSVTKSSDSTITPPLTGPLLRDTHALTPLDLGISPPVAPYIQPDTPSMTSSCFPSPDFPPSSFEVPRSLTAASSFTDDHIPTLLTMGEPGPELRISVDDVPSLTSSNSTMTSAYRHGNVPYGMGGPGPGSRGRSERTSSISSAFTPRPESRRSTRSKRASLVSLSRLVGASSGEKSKLSMEVQPDAVERATKDKKGKRLSRLMHFWKAKDGVKDS